MSKALNSSARSFYAPAPRAGRRIDRRQFRVRSVPCLSGVRRAARQTPRGRRRSIAGHRGQSSTTRPTTGPRPPLSSLTGAQGKIDAEFVAVLDAVAVAPPPQFAGGGKWEAMHGSMGGWHEIRLTGPGREQFRLFCVLENAANEELLRRGLTKPTIAVVTGMRKPWRTKFSETDYSRVRRLGDEHKANHPRRIAR
jgi:hypothetical protein